MFILDAILGHTQLLSRPSGGGWFVQIVFIERMSLIMTFQADVILEHISFFIFFRLHGIC